MGGTIGLKAIFSAEDKNLSATMARIATGVRGLQYAGTGLGKVDKFNASVATGLKNVGFAAVGAGTAIGLAAYEFVGSSATFEDSLAKVTSVVTPMSGTVVDATNRMRLASLGWSKAHRDSATDFLDTSYMMISAGLNEVQALEATRTAMTVATATFGVGREAAGLLATVYNNMGDKTRNVSMEMTRLGDVITKTQQTFQFANLDQLSEGLKFGIPTALQYRIGIEELSAVIGQLNNAGLQGSMAGTAFTATMRSMTSGSKELGFAVAKTRDGGVSFTGTMVNIEKKFGSLSKMSDQTRTRFQKAFGDEGFRGLSLMIGKSDELAANLKKVHDSGGVSKDAAAGIESKGTNRFKILGNNIEALKIGIGDGLAPAVDKVIGKLFGVTNATGEWVDQNKQLIATSVTKFVDDAIPAIVNFGHQLQDGWHNVAPILRGVGGALSWANSLGLGENVVKIGLGFAAFAGTIKVLQGGVSTIGGALKLAHGAAGWIKDTRETVAALRQAKAISEQLGPANIVAFGDALRRAGDGAVVAKGGISSFAKYCGMAAASGGPILAVAAAIGSVAAALYNLYKLVGESGGLSGFGENTAAGVWGAVGSGTKSWGVNGFLEGYAGADDARKNKEAMLRDDVYNPQWTGAANAVGDLTGFGRGYGRNLNDYAGAFGIAPAARSAGPYASGYAMPGMAPPVAPPPPTMQQRTSPEELRAMVAQELTVKVVAEPGTSAEVVKKPSRGGKITNPPSGGFFD